LFSLKSQRRISSLIYDFGENCRKKRPLGRPRHRWDYNIKMEVREIGWDDMEWSSLSEDMDRWRALQNAVIKFRVL
jgi:hypothetical protein